MGIEKGQTRAPETSWEADALVQTKLPEGLG